MKEDGFIFNKCGTYAIVYVYYLKFILKKHILQTNEYKSSTSTFFSFCCGNVIKLSDKL